MYYECEADYQAHMNAQAEAEYEAQQAEQYNEYLNNLLESGNNLLYSIEICLDLFNSYDFKKSNMQPIEYLIKRKNILLNLDKQTSDDVF